MIHLSCTEPTTIDQILSHCSVLMSHKFKWELCAGFDFVYPLLFSPFWVLLSIGFGWLLSIMASCRNQEIYLVKCCSSSLSVVQSSDPAGISCCMSDIASVEFCTKPGSNSEGQGCAAAECPWVVPVTAATLGTPEQDCFHHWRVVLCRSWSFGCVSAGQEFGCLPPCFLICFLYFLCRIFFMGTWGEQPQWFFPRLFRGCSYWVTKESSLVRDSKMFNDHF